MNRFADDLTGLVPGGWRRGALRHFTRFFTGWTPPTEDAAAYDGDHYWAGIGDLGPRYVQSTSKSLSDSAVAGKPAAMPGDLLFGFKLSVGAVSLASRRLYTNEAIAVFQDSPELCAAYAYYALPVFVPANAGTNIYGARLLNDSLIRSAQLLVPPREEQRAIADYLDRETARIDELIAKQERLIELLRERRRAALESALAGLETGTDRAPTRYSWLPPLPRTWTPKQLGFVAQTLAGFAYASEAFVEEREGTRLLRGINIKPGALSWDQTVSVSDQIAHETRAFRLGLGDLVLGLDRPFIGTGARVARVGLQDLPALLVQRVLRIRCGRPLESAFVELVLASQAFRAYLEPEFSGISVPHASEWQIRKFVLPWPPPDDMRVIVADLGETLSKIDALIAKAERFIELSKERRAALITAAVTGQIDVKAAA